jgi:rare lipoprotein A (peptidoglycan hydrolase)
MITQTLASLLASITLGTASVKIAVADQCGTATYYDNWYQGRETATTGVYYDRYKPTAASWHYPLGTWLLVRNTRTNQSVTVEVNDRGGYELLDLSEEASVQLSDDGLPDNHSICVEVL